jgi:hypothetical protein
MAAGSGLDMTEMDGSVVTSCRTGCDILAKKTVSMCHDGSPSLGHVAIAINNRGYSTPLRGRDARGGGESLVDFKFQDLKRAYQRFREDHTMNSSSWPSGGLARRTELAIESWLTTYPNPQHWIKRFEHYMAVFEGFSNAVSFHNVFEKCHEWDSRPGKMK